MSFGLSGKMAATASNVAIGALAGAVPGLGQLVLDKAPFRWRARVADMLYNRQGNAASADVPAVVEAQTPIERALHRYSYEQAKACAMKSSLHPRGSL